MKWIRTLILPDYLGLETDLNYLGLETDLMCGVFALGRTRSSLLFRKGTCAPPSERTSPLSKQSVEEVLLTVPMSPRQEGGQVEEEKR